MGNFGLPLRRTFVNKHLTGIRYRLLDGFLVRERELTVSRTREKGPEVRDSRKRNFYFEKQRKFFEILKISNSPNHIARIIIAQRSNKFSAAAFMLICHPMSNLHKLHLQTKVSHCQMVESIQI